MNILEVINELERFSNNIISFGSPIDEKSIRKFEDIYSLKLPNDFKILLRKYNGISLFGTEIYGIMWDMKVYSLEKCYVFEHFDVQNKMPLFLVPFSPDGKGNHYCFDTRYNSTISYPIVFWQHDYLYLNNDDLEITHQNLGDWIKEVMIDWLLEDYDYNGTPR